MPTAVCYICHSFLFGNTFITNYYYANELEWNDSTVVVQRVGFIIFTGLKQKSRFKKYIDIMSFSFLMLLA